MKKYFNKKLIMAVEEEEEIFPLSNKCWIYDKLFDLVDKK